jgi:hypothetical protein
MRILSLIFLLVWSVSIRAGFFSSLSGAASAVAGAGSAYSAKDQESGSGLSNAINTALNTKINKDRGVLGNIADITTNVTRAYQGYWGQSGCCKCTS